MVASVPEERMVKEPFVTLSVSLTLSGRVRVRALLDFETSQCTYQEICQHWTLKKNSLLSSA